jgi:hypothetical protein
MPCRQIRPQSCRKQANAHHHGHPGERAATVDCSQFHCACSAKHGGVDKVEQHPLQAAERYRPSQVKQCAIFFADRNFSHAAAIVGFGHMRQNKSGATFAAPLF